jgi:hypothetical protein
MHAFKFSFLVTLIVGGATAAACGGGTTNPATPADSGGGDDGGMLEATTGGDDASDAAADVSVPYPAFVPPDPPQVHDVGGPTVMSPKIVPIFFATDDMTTTTALADFVSKVGQTNYWKTIVSEYGAGPATGAPPIELTHADDPPATYDDSQIQAWLAAKLNANDPTFGTPDANTIYALFFPQGVTITLGGGGGGGPDGGVDGGTDGGTPDGGGGGGRVSKSCVSFGGYHDNIQLDGAHQNLAVAYAVVPRCANFGNLTGLDAITGPASHEFMEAVSDPYPSTNPAYAQIDTAHFYWSSVIGGGEIGDMCVPDPTAFTKFPELATYEVQRGWSNMAIKAGHNPCVPAPSTPYFNSVPIMTDTVTVSFGGQTVMTKGVSIPQGQSKTIEVDLFSDAPTSGPWGLSAMDGAQLRGQTAQLGFAWDKIQGKNGDKRQLTITVMTASTRKRETFLVLSKLAGQEFYWAGVVGN